MTNDLTTGVSGNSDNTQPTSQTTDDNLQGSGEGKWYDSLNDEYKNHPSIQKFQDANGMAKSYLSLEAMLGQEKIPVPKNADDTNAWALYRKAFDVPETADNYNIKVEGVEDSKLKGLKDIFHKYNISQAAAQELTNAHIQDFKDYEAAKVQAFNAEADKASEELRKDWGAKYDENLAAAKTFLEKMSTSKEEYDYFDSKIGNDPKFIKLLSKMGQSISEGNLGGFEGQGGGFAKTPAEAKEELDKILSDPDDAFWAGARNKRNDMKYCKQHNLTYVSESERKARVQYVNSLMSMQG